MESLCQLDVFYGAITPYLPLSAICALRCSSKSLLNAMTNNNLMFSFAIKIKRMLKDVFVSEYDNIMTLFIDNKCLISGDIILEIIIDDEDRDCDRNHIEINILSKYYENIKISKNIIKSSERGSGDDVYHLSTNKWCSFRFYPTSNLAINTEETPYGNISKNYYDPLSNRLYIKNIDAIMRRTVDVTQFEPLNALKYVLLGFKLDKYDEFEKKHLGELTHLFT